MMKTMAVLAGSITKPMAKSLSFSKLFLAATLATALSLAGTPAHANAGLPMLMIVWPAMWALLIPIVLVEAAVGMRVLHLDFIQAVRMAGIANLFSTIVGIPMTWFFLMIVELRVGKGGGVYGLDTLKGKILSVTVQSPWLVPYPETELRWMLPAAELFLCVPCFLMSVWTESMSASWTVQTQVSMADILRWSWLANGLSYGMISGLLLFMLFRGLRNRKPSIRKTETTWLSLLEDFAVDKLAGPVALFLAGIASRGLKPAKMDNQAKQVSLNTNYGPQCSFCQLIPTSAGEVVVGSEAAICRNCAKKFAARQIIEEVQVATTKSVSCSFCGNSSASGKEINGSQIQICSECLQNCKAIFDA